MFATNVTVLKRQKTKTCFPKHFNHLFHDVVNSGRTSLRRLHPVTLLNVLDDVGKRNSGIGDSAVGVNFPEKNSEAPHITFAGKGLRPQGFGSCPLDRKLNK